MTIELRNPRLFFAYRLWECLLFVFVVTALAHGGVWQIGRSLPPLRFFLALGLGGLTWTITFQLFGLYESRRLGSRVQEILDTILAVTIGTLGIVIISLFLGFGLPSARFVLLVWLVTTAMVVGCRLAIRFALGQFRIRGHNLRNVLIVGNGTCGYQFAELLRQSPKLGYHLLGFVDQTTPSGTPPEPLHGGWFGTVANLPDLLAGHAVDEVVVALPRRSNLDQFEQVVAICQEQGIRVRLLWDLFGADGSSVRLDRLGAWSMVTLESGLIGWQGVIKRFVDVTGSLFLIILLFPLLILIGLLVRLTSRGPIFFFQERVGCMKRPFQLIKFRTMERDAEHRLLDVAHLNEVEWPAFKIKNDPRFSPLGRFLRRTSLDELPQLINVLRGEMSLVGPRPLQFHDLKGLSAHAQQRRFSFRPGITCLWQVSGRSHLPFEKWMELDVKYVDEWSLWLDLRILLKTLPAVLLRGGAY